MTPVPFPNSYWVFPRVFLAGEHPAAAGEHLTRKRLQALLQAGVTAFVDLTEISSGRYDRILFDEAEGYELEVAYKNFPIRDFTAPAAIEVIAILDYLDLVISQHQMVYLHCWGGIGRTGTIVGCYLTRHGLDGKASLDRIAELRRTLPPPYVRSPEADDQVERVRYWPIGQ